MATVPLSLSDLCDITVTISPAAFAAPQYNQGLLIGSSMAANIATYGRLQQFTAANWDTAMLAAGFATNSPEYIAAGIYFGVPQPPQYLWVGVQNTSATNIQSLSIDVPGTLWKVGDLFTVTQGSNVTGYGVILAVTTGGVPTSIGVAPNQAGTGYSLTGATGLVATAVLPSVGVGLEVNITAIGESILQAAQACRLANSTWWAYRGTGTSGNNYFALDADHLANAAWASPQWQTTFYFGVSNDAAIPTSATDDLASQMQALQYKVFMLYATAQSALYPGNAFADVAAMGVAMGLNTGLANSFFTMGHKVLTGIAPEQLTQTQFGQITGKGFNAYCNFAPYKFLEYGRCCDGNPFYLYLFVALLVVNLQYNVMNDMEASPAIPQDNAGQTQLLHDANQACAVLASIGFLAPGTWTGRTISAGSTTLENGDPLPLGYLNFSAPYSQQSSGAHAAGQAMPVYCAIASVGAVQSALIGVNVQL
jgi:hypothetical protein